MPSDPTSLRGEPRNFIPALGRLWRSLGKNGWPLIRFFAGVMLMPHGAQKLFAAFGGGGLSGTTASFQKMGLEPALPLALLAGSAEFFGGLLIAVGFLTRPAAFAGFVVMMVAVFHVHLSRGFFLSSGGYEFALLWGMVLLGIILHGGGRLSVDRAIGREF